MAIHDDIMSRRNHNTLDKGNHSDPNLPSAEELVAKRQYADSALAAVDAAAEKLNAGVGPEVVQDAMRAMAHAMRAHSELSFATEEVVRAVEAGRLGLRIEGEPLHLVLVRHGRSVANERERILALPEDDQRRADYQGTPNYALRLLSLGRRQAEAAGKWMASELGFGFDAAYCPDYVRSQETGGVIGTEVDLCVKWRESGLFGERNWGDFETLSAEAQEQGYGQRIEDPRHWTPPHGESMGSLELGVRLALGTLHRKHNMQNVLVSSHGERINAFRSVIERLPLDRFKEIMDEGPPNCGIVHYSRVNPKTGEIAPHWAWMRLVCPWKMDIVKAGEKWDGEWRKIERPEYTSQELLERVSQFEQIYDQEL